MAKQQGANSITVWMIVFVALWLTSTVFLVILYTGQEDLNSEITRLTTAKERLISSQQERSIDLVRNARPTSEGGPTVVGLLEQARSETAELATGDPTDDVASATSKLDQIINAIEMDGLVPASDEYAGLSYNEAITNLYDAFRAEHDLRQSAETRLAQLDSEVAKLSEQAAALTASFEEQTSEINAQLAEIEADRTAYRQDRDAAVASLEQEFENRRAQNTAQLTEARQLKTQSDERLAIVRARIKGLKSKLGGLFIGPKENSTARIPDGKILTAIPGDRVVYINLGRNDALTLGLRFAIYSAQTGIPADGRSKAQIEVVSISESSAECDIISTSRNEVILEGDLIANPIYSSDTPQNVLVVGSYDLNRDGLPDRDGSSAITAIVKNWGGKVIDQLNPETDFVVVGAAPRKPRPANDVSPDQVEQNRLRQESWDAYYDVIESARSMSIPMMTQDVFFNFLGYSNKYARR